MELLLLYCQSDHITYCDGDSEHTDILDSQVATVTF